MKPRTEDQWLEEVRKAYEAGYKHGAQAYNDDEYNAEYNAVQMEQDAEFRANGYMEDGYNRD